MTDRFAAWWTKIEMAVRMLEDPELSAFFERRRDQLREIARGVFERRVAAMAPAEPAELFSGDMKGAMRQLTRNVEAHGWTISNADIDLDTGAVDFEFRRGAPTDRVLRLKGKGDRVSLERFALRRGQEARGRRGDRYMADTLDMDFLGRSRGTVQELAQEAIRYIAENAWAPKQIEGHAPPAITAPSVVVTVTPRQAQAAGQLPTNIGVGTFQGPIPLFRAFDSRGLEDIAQRYQKLVAAGHSSPGQRVHLRGRTTAKGGFSDVAEAKYGASFTADRNQAVQWALRWLAPGSGRVAGQWHDIYDSYEDMLSKIPEGAAYWTGPAYLVEIDGNGHEFSHATLGSRADYAKNARIELPLSDISTEAGANLHATVDEVKRAWRIESDGRLTPLDWPGVLRNTKNVYTVSAGGYTPSGKGETTMTHTAPATATAKPAELRRSSVNTRWSSRAKQHGLVEVGHTYHTDVLEGTTEQWAAFRDDLLALRAGAEGEERASLTKLLDSTGALRPERDRSASLLPPKWWDLRGMPRTSIEQRFEIAKSNDDRSWDLVDRAYATLLNFPTKKAAEEARKFAVSYVHWYGDIDLGSFPYDIYQPLHYDRPADIRAWWEEQAERAGKGAPASSPASTVEAPRVIRDTGPEEMTVEEAREWAWRSSDSLANLPPPDPDKEDFMGLSWVSNGPIRTFLANGPDQPDAAYLGAMEYLRDHRHTQLGSEAWQAAYDALRTAVSPEITPEKARLLIKGKAVTRADSGENTDGSYIWDEKKGVLRIQTKLRKGAANKISNDTLKAAGLRRGVDYDWVVEYKGFEKVFWLKIEPHAIERFAAFLEERNRPTMAAALRAQAPLWLNQADTVGKETDASKIAAPKPKPERPEPEVWMDDRGAILSKHTPYAVGQILRRLKGDVRGIWVFKDGDDGVNGFWPRAGETILSSIDYEQDMMSATDKKQAAAWANLVWQAVNKIPDPKECPARALTKATRLSEVTDAPVRQEAERLLETLRWPGTDRPFPYQQIGIAFAKMAGGRVLIGDDMGLGKTLQAIGFLKLTPGRSIIVCPAGVLYNWRSQVMRWAPELKPVVIKDSKIALPPGDDRTVLITTWALQARRVQDLLSWGPTTIVADEAHYARNYKAQRSKAFASLARKAQNAILLTGTPAENGFQEIWPLLNVLDPGHWSNWERFVRRYLGAEKGRFGWEFREPRNMEEFEERASCNIIRRLKSEVARDLPEKTRQFVWVPLEGKVSVAYQKALEGIDKLLTAGWKRRILTDARKRIKQGKPIEEVWNWVAAQERSDAAKALTVVGELRRLVGRLKIPLAVEWVKSFFEANPKEGLVVFAEHKAVIAGLVEGLAKVKVGEGSDARPLRVATATGSDSAQTKAKRVEEFQTGKIDVIIGSQAIREGVDLFRANQTLFVERWWVPTREEQAEDRTHRTGQKRNVTISYLMLEDTVDQRLHDIVEGKRAILAASVGTNKWAEEKAEGDIQAEVSADFLRLAAGRDVPKITRAEFDAALAELG